MYSNKTTTKLGAMVDDVFTNARQACVWIADLFSDHVLTFHLIFDVTTE